MYNEREGRGDQHDDMIYLDYEKRLPVDVAALKGRTVLDSDLGDLIKEDCTIRENGQVKVVYTVPDYDDAEIVHALQHIKYGTGYRTLGLKTQSRMLGYRPRLTLRNDYCNSTSLAKDQPREHDVMLKLANRVADLYREHIPGLYADHDEKTGRVLQEYRITGTPFTSGNINKNNAVKFHHDRGNFKGVASGMPAFRKDVDGGHLVLPEYGVALEIANRSISIFDGQDLLHGVSPLRYRHRDGYRYTIVYYALEQMWKCETGLSELERVRNKKTERERRRAGMIE